MEVQDARRVREAADVLAAAVAEIDLGSMLPAAHRELVALGERIERTGRTVKSMAAAKVAESAVWRGDGDRTPEDWLARTTGTTRAEAAKELQCGRDLQLVPEVAQAATAGELSVKQTEAIAGAAAVDPAAAGRLLDSAKGKGLRELQDECRATRTNADPDPEATRARIHAKRSYRTWTDPDGTGHLHLTGPSDVIARIDNAVRHRCDRIFRDARRDGSPRARPTPTPSTPPPSSSPAAATARRCRPGPTPRSSCGSTSRRCSGAAPLDGETCEIAGLGPIPVSVVREWMENAFLAAIVTKGTEITKVVHLGRRFTSEQRTALQWQDPICARKGCANRLGLEYDHFEDWADTHTTRVDRRPRGSARPATASRPLGWHGLRTRRRRPVHLHPTARRAIPPPPAAPTVVHELAEATRAALRARRGALARPE